MASSAAVQMVQLNMRVNGQDKQQAEDVLRLMDTSTTELVRKVLAKVASGAKAYTELMGVLERSEQTANEQDAVTVDPVLMQGYSVVDNFCRSLGYESAADVPMDTRAWAEMYHEAMVAHYEEKGWLQ